MIQLVWGEKWWSDKKRSLQVATSINSLIHMLLIRSLILVHIVIATQQYTLRMQRCNTVR
jgi:hypothetical protein